MPPGRCSSPRAATLITTPELPELFFALRKIGDRPGAMPGALLALLRGDFDIAHAFDRPGRGCCGGMVRDHEAAGRLHPAGAALARERCRSPPPACDAAGRARAIGCRRCPGRGHGRVAAALDGRRSARHRARRGRGARRALVGARPPLASRRPMDELASWILLPIVVVLASWGTGLLVERGSGPSFRTAWSCRSALRPRWCCSSVPYRLGASAAVATPLMASRSPPGSGSDAPGP